MVNGDVVPLPQSHVLDANSYMTARYGCAKGEDGSNSYVTKVHKFMFRILT